MRQFNLDEYLANPSKKVITRRGLNARIICTDRKDLIYPIVALIETKSGRESLQYFTKDGKYYVDDLYEDDLFFAPEKHEGWTPVYREPTGKIRFGYAYSTKKEAVEASKHDTRYITTTNVEWEE